MAYSQILRTSHIPGRAVFYYSDLEITKKWIKEKGLL